MLTSWELIENLLRTLWEKEENEKSLLHLHSLQTQKVYLGHVEPSHWLHAIFICKIVGHRFWPRPYYGIIKYWRTYWGVLMVICIKYMGVPPMFKFSFQQWSNLIGFTHHPNFDTVIGLGQTGFYFAALGSSPLAQSIQLKGGQHLPKHMGLRSGTIGNALETKAKLKPEFFSITYLTGY